MTKHFCDICEQECFTKGIFPSKKPISKKYSIKPDITFSRYVQDDHLQDVEVAAADICTACACKILQDTIDLNLIRTNLSNVKTKP